MKQKDKNKIQELELEKCFSIENTETIENINIRGILALIFKKKNIKVKKDLIRLNKEEKNIFNMIKIKIINNSYSEFYIDYSLYDDFVIDFILESINQSAYYNKIKKFNEEKIVQEIISYSEYNSMFEKNEGKVIKKKIETDLYKNYINDIELKNKIKILFLNISDEDYYNYYEIFSNKDIDIYVYNNVKKDFDMVAKYLFGFKELKEDSKSKFDLIISPTKEIIKVEKSHNLFDYNSINIDNNIKNITKMIELLNKNGRAILVADQITLSSISNREFRKKIINSNLVEKIKISNKENVNEIINIEGYELYKERYSEEILETEQNLIPIYEEEISPILILNKNKKINDVLFEKYKIQKNVDNYNEIIEKVERITKDQLVENLYSLNPNIYIDKLKIKQGKKLESVLKDLFRGYQFSKDELERIKVDINDKNIYKLLEIGKINNDGDIIEKLSLINPSKIGKNLDRYLLEDGDIITTARGDKLKVALIELKNNDEKIIANGSMNVIRLDKKRVNPKYIKLFFDSETGRETLERIKIGRTIASINTGDLKNIEIPCVTMEEQNEIAKSRDEIIRDIKILKNKYKELAETI